MYEENTPPLDVMRQIYADNFSLHYINGSFKEKMALISLLCHLKKEISKKKSGISFYELIKKIDETLPEDFVKAITVICEDFSYNCYEFETFGLDVKDMPKFIKNILKKIMPF